LKPEPMSDAPRVSDAPDEGKLYTYEALIAAHFNSEFQPRVLELLRQFDAGSCAYRGDAMSDPKWMEKLREHKRPSESCTCIEDVIARLAAAEAQRVRLARAVEAWAQAKRRARDVFAAADAVGSDVIAVSVTELTGAIDAAEAELFAALGTTDGGVTPPSPSESTT